MGLPPGPWPLVFDKPKLQPQGRHHRCVKRQGAMEIAAPDKDVRAHAAFMPQASCWHQADALVPQPTRWLAASASFSSSGLAYFWSHSLTLGSISLNHSGGIMATTMVVR
jgi:hypothetical protein